jgi:dolichol-phosphate mannosyltransferase
VKLSIVIPVRNESRTVVPLLQRVRAVDCGMPKEIIIVDGASTDGTREALAALPPAEDLVLLLEDAARGKGRAVRSGFERATGDIVMVQDADLELDPSEIPALLAPLLSGKARAVFGSRFKGRLTDILTCYKVLRTDLARSLALECNGFDLDAEITCRLLRAGERIVEVPVSYAPRSVDEGKKLSPAVGWSVLHAILRVRFDRQGRRNSSDDGVAPPAEHRAGDVATNDYVDTSRERSLD